MIKLNIFKGEKDESSSIFIQEEGKEKQQLTFDAIKDFSVRILEAVTKGEDCSYQVSAADNNLVSYKEMIEKVFKSVLDDIELQEIFKEALSKENESASSTN